MGRKIVVNGATQLGDPSAEAKPDYHRLKTMVTRSIEQELRSRNLDARNGRTESNILVKNPREQRRVHKGQGSCWRCQPQGSV